MRIFIALDIPAGIRARIREYMDRARGYAPEARWARPEGVHLTLKFVGEVNDAKVQEIKTALAAVKAQPFEVKFSGAGFFPTPKSPRVFWIGVEGGKSLSQLAHSVDNITHLAGIAKEERAYSPHLTLARAGAGSGSAHQLRPLQYLLEKEEMPQFGTMTAQEFWLYRSELARGGAKYTKLERFQLAAG
jgi:2'-5' RNA ligase